MTPILACEVVGPNGRAYTGMVPNFTFAFGYMIMSLFSYLIPEWRPLTFLLAALTFPFLLTWWAWPESRVNTIDLSSNGLNTVSDV